MATVNVDQIYAEYGGKIMGYIRARIRGKADAEDLFSEGFERIIKKLDDFDP